MYYIYHILYIYINILYILYILYIYIYIYIYIYLQKSYNERFFASEYILCKKNKFLNVRQFFYNFT